MYNTVLDLILPQKYNVVYYPCSNLIRGFLFISNFLKIISKCKENSLVVIFNNDANKIKICAAMHNILFVVILYPILMINKYLRSEVYYLFSTFNNPLELGTYKQCFSSNFRENSGNYMNRIKFILSRFFLSSGTVIISSKKGIDFNNLINRLIISNSKIKKFKILKGNPNTNIIISESVVLKNPSSKIALQRCRNNRRILNFLSHSSFRNEVPFYAETLYVDKTYFFCEQKKSGLSFEIDNFDDIRLLNLAVKLLINLHCSHSTKVVMDMPILQRLVIKTISNLKYHVKDFDTIENLARIEGFLLHNFIHKKVNLVLFHGDFKLENVLFNTKNFRIEAIIDWDLAKKQWFPALDLLYLLFYDRAVRNKMTVLRFIKFELIPKGFSAFERDSLLLYFDSLCLNYNLLQPLFVIFCLHHVVERFQEMLRNTSCKSRNWFEAEALPVINSLSIDKLNNIYL